VCKILPNILIMAHDTQYNDTKHNGIQHNNKSNVKSFITFGPDPEPAFHSRDRKSTVPNNLDPLLKIWISLMLMVALAIGVKLRVRYCIQDTPFYL
jgi:hypothetical protein